MDTAQTTTTNPNKRRNILVGVLVGLVALGAIGAALGDSDAGSSFNDGEWQAHAQCAEFTRARLKAPSTADFPEYDDRGVTITRGGNRWSVVSFVDSQNGFGAQVRTGFRCVVTDLGDQWRLESWTER